MPDITMCDNKECPKKESCYRFKATPNEYWQAYSTFKYDEKEGCVFYVKLEKK